MSSSAGPAPELETAEAPETSAAPGAEQASGAEAPAEGAEGEEYLASSSVIGFVLAPLALVIVIVGLVWGFYYLTYDRSTVQDYAVRLRSANKAERWQAALDLIETNQASQDLVPIVIEMLEAPDEEQTVNQVGWATSDLLKKPEERQVNLRWYAAAALGKIGGERALEKLIELLSDPNEGVRFYAAHSLGRMRAGAAVEPLIHLMREDADNATRMAAAWALGETADPRAVEPLAEIFRQSDDLDLRRNTAVALTRFGKENYVKLAEADRKAIESLLIEMTKDDNAHTREQGRRALRLTQQYQKG